MNDNEITHVHRLAINLWVVSLVFCAMRTGASTNVSMSIRLWRCAMSLTLFYIGE